MILARSFVWATAVAAGIFGLGLISARADTIITLEGVTFADGGTASGYFELNVYGYIEAADITTTSGTSMDSQPIAGYAYLAGLSNNSVPFDTGFYFNSSVDAFSLSLIADDNVTNGGFNPLVDGSDSDHTLAGSYENCQENPSACSGVSYLDGRLVTAGTLYTAEPASFGLLAVGGVALLAIRRRRSGIIRAPG